MVGVYKIRVGNAAPNKANLESQIISRFLGESSSRTHSKARDDRGFARLQGISLPFDKLIGDYMEVS